MASRNEREVGVRISVRDAEIAKRALAEFGTEGQGALKRIEASSVPANKGLLNLSGAILRTKEYSRDFAVEATRNFLGPVAAITTAVGSIEVLRGAIERVKQVAETGDIAERLGLSVAKLQGLDATFKESGNDVDELNAGLQTFSSNLAKAASQGGPLKDLFDINKVKLSGDTLTDLKTYADLVKNAATEQQKLYLVTLAFGRGSKEIVDLLTQGGDGIGRAADEAERLGTALDDADVDKARELNKELVEVSLKLDAAKDRFSLLIAPAEIATLNAFNDAIEQTRNLLTDIQNLDLKGIAKIIGRDEGDHPSLFGSNGAFAIDWFGNGTAVTGNRGLLTGASGANSGLLDIHDRRDAASILAGTSSGGTSSKPTIVPTAPDHAAEQQAKRIKDVTDALRQQLSILGMTDREAEISNNLSRAKVTAGSAEGKTIAELTGELYDQKKAIEAVNSATAFLAQTGENAFEGLIDGTKSWQDTLGDTVKTLEKAVLQAALLGSGPLAGLFGTQSQTAGGTGGVLGSLLGGLFKPAQATGFIPGITGPKLFAKGGIASTPSIFGDAGAEAAVPLPDGRSIPVTLTGGRGGDLTVNVSIQRLPGSGDDSVSTSKQGNVLQLKALIYDTVAEGGAKGGNPINKMLRTNFGARPAITRRGG